MATPLSPESLAQIQSIVRQISVANDLDDEIQAALQSHIEEKTMGYLSGHEQITEADALLLARTHSGDPRTVEVLFRRSHSQRREEPRSSRRTSLAGVLLLVVAVVAYRVGYFIPLPSMAQGSLSHNGLSMHPVGYPPSFAWQARVFLAACSVCLAMGILLVSCGCGQSLWRVARQVKCAR